MLTKHVKVTKVNFTPNGINKLPKTPGVYISGCGRDINYVGSSVDVQRRVKQQARDGLDGCYIKTIATRTRQQAYDLERALIGDICPSENKSKPRHCKTSLWDQLFR